jgi:hypothetical protein
MYFSKIYLILPSHLHLGLRSGLFPSRYSTELSFSSVHVCCIARRLAGIGLITVIKRMKFRVAPVTFSFITKYSPERSVIGHFVCVMYVCMLHVCILHTRARSFTTIQSVDNIIILCILAHVWTGYGKTTFRSE